MKFLIVPVLSCLFFLNVQSQKLTNDSLSGFNFPKAMLEAHKKNFYGSEAKVYLKYAERVYLIEKYNLPVITPQNYSIGKYSSSQTANAPCLNEDFEAVPTGSLPMSSTGWTVTEAFNNISNPLLCGSNIAFTTPTANANAIVVATPYADPNCNNVGTSPLGGNHVIQLNRNNPNLFKMTKIAQTFNVTSSNWFYKYAYKGVFYSAVHGGCCDHAIFMIRFFDCTNNLISSISHSVTPENDTCIANVATCGINTPWPWVSVVTPSALNTTPNWVLEGVNLSQYIGSCVTVEVIASNCTGGAHQGYCYFDSQCSSTAGVVGNGVMQPSASFTSCSSTATLSGLPCFTNYYWQGPVSSTVSGSTNSVIATNVPGSYTITSSANNVSSTQVINVSFATSLPTVTISATMLNSCQGASYTLQALGNNINSYLWNTLSTSSTISIPTLTTGALFMVTVTDAFGCTATDTKSISLLPLPIPSVQIVSSNSVLCMGISSIVSTTNSGVSSYTWSTGVNTPTAAITPTTSPATITVVVTNSLGCTNTATATYSVKSGASIVVNITPSGSICPGQKVVLNAFGLALVNYSWSTGANSAAIQVSPTVTTVYTVTATDTTNGCQSQTTRTIAVKQCLGFSSEQESIQTHLEVFPNPATDAFTIKTSATSRVQLVNDQGQIVEEILLSSNNNYSQIVSGLPKGIYIVRSEKASVKLIVK